MTKVTDFNKERKAIQEQINALYAEYNALCSKCVEDSYRPLNEAIRNLLSGCGKYLHHACEHLGVPARYYLDTVIPGVKNIRMGDNNTVIVKITSPVCLPNSITIDDVTYKIEIIQSNNYTLY
jgi:hypothetical protein